MSKKIYWPDSQGCIGCKHGKFLVNEPESSVYACSKGKSAPEEDCNEPDVSNLEELEDDILIEMRDGFFEKNNKALPFDLGDFEELILEIEKRSNK